ncbi:hypothetical protein V495_08026, partial [Pseudogymnoascus sp. VKM F-4514 (FW-929)]
MKTIACDALAAWLTAPRIFCPIVNTKANNPRLKIKTMKKLAKFSNLPPEIIYLILGNVSPHDLLSFLRVFPYLAASLPPELTHAAGKDWTCMGDRGRETILHLAAEQGDSTLLTTLLANPTTDPNTLATISFSTFSPSTDGRTLP